MKLPRRIAGFFGYSGDPMPTAGISGSLSGGGWTTLGSIPLVSSLGRQREATYRMVYLTNPYVWAAVEMHATGIARLPLHVFALDDRGRKQRQRSDVPLTPGRPTGGQSLDRLLTNPQPGLSRNAMLGGTIRDRRIYGNALWEIQRNPGTGQIAKLARRPWRRVIRVEQINDDGGCIYQIVGRSDRPSERRWLAQEEVIHFGFWADPESPIAPSLLDSCRHTLALHDAVVRHLIAFFANSMRPSGHLSVDGLTREQGEMIRTMLTELYASPENAGKILVSQGKWEQIGANLDNAQIAELIDKSREEIATATSIPPPMLGLLQYAIKSNVKELREQYARDSLGPLASDFEQELMAQLLPQQPAWSSLFVEFQMAEQLRPDLEARALVYQRLMFVIAIDEIRAMENLPALDIPGVSDVPWAIPGSSPLQNAATAKVPTARPSAAMVAALHEAVSEGRISMVDAEPIMLAANGNGSHP